MVLDDILIEMRKSDLRSCSIIILEFVLRTRSGEITMAEAAPY